MIFNDLSSFIIDFIHLYDYIIGKVQNRVATRGATATRVEVAGIIAHWGKRSVEKMSVTKSAK